MKKKTIATVMTAVMLFGVVTGSTLAWLTAESEEVTNTFTVGNINIVLDEANVNIKDGEEIIYTEYVKNNAKVEKIEDAERVTENEYELIPGSTYSKDPKVTVKADSENCYVYVKITENNNSIIVDNASEQLIEWSVGDNWKLIDAVENIYVYTDENDNAKIVTTSEKDTVLESIIKDDQIEINDALTKAMIDADGFIAPTLKFDAYAVQSANMADAEAAWDVTFCTCP